MVFRSGLGSEAIDWRRVQPAIAAATAACVYDRAGYGFSDAATRRGDATNAVADLRALIGAARLRQPVVLVGHSLGGLFATMYAERFPRDVAGAVLVDPAFAGQSEAIADAVGPAAARTLAAADARTIAALDRCVGLAASGRLARPDEASSDCLDNPPDPNGAVHRVRMRDAKRAASERAVRSEFHDLNLVGADGRTVDDREAAATIAKGRGHPPRSARCR